MHMRAIDRIAVAGAPGKWEDDLESLESYSLQWRIYLEDLMKL
jgi:hypothetical protein